MRTAGLACALGVIVWASSAALQSFQGPAFEVASVRASAPAQANGFSPSNPGIALPGGRWFARNVPLSFIVTDLYGLRREQLAGGPDWVDSRSFDIEARADPNATPEQVTSMAKALLAERFKLRMHVEPRPITVYALVRANREGPLGPGPRPTLLACQSPTRTGVNGAPQRCGVRAPMVDGIKQLRMVGQPLWNFLVLSGARTTMGGPVVDRTGLTGAFDIDLDFVPQRTIMSAAGDVPAGPSFASAIESQLGLKFERRKEQVDVHVIDHVEMPTPD